MWSGMVQFPMLVLPTVDHSDDWLIVHGDETQLAHAEADLEEKVLRHFLSNSYLWLRGIKGGWHELENFWKGVSGFLDLKEI